MLSDEDVRDQADRGRSLRSLDDDDDREELRRRYYGLMQELRVLLPGVQVLVAFLLTTPFASRFDAVDDLGHELYGLALVTGMLAVVCFMTPTAFHRFGERRARKQRLQTGITLVRVGMVMLAISLLSAQAVVARFVFGPVAAALVTAGVAAAMAAFWLVLPVHSRRIGS